MKNALNEVEREVNAITTVVPGAARYGLLPRVDLGLRVGLTGAEAPCSSLGII